MEAATVEVVTAMTDSYRKITSATAQKEQQEIKMKQMWIFWVSPWSKS